MLTSGDRLRAILKDKSISVPKLAEKIGVSTQAVYDLLKRDYIKPDMRKRLAETLSVSDTDLLPETIKGENGKPFFDCDITSLPSKVFDGNYNLAQYETVCLPSIQDVDFLFTYYSNSMQPTIEAGSILGCKRIKGAAAITYGDLFLVITENDRIVRRLIHAPQKGHVLAVSDSNERIADNIKLYNDISISLRKIEHVFAIKLVIKLKRL